MTQHKRRLIWFCETEKVADHPEWLPMLRDEIGLTTIMPESHVCHTSGFASTPELARRGPFEDWRERLDQWPRGEQGIYPPVAGTVSGFDDEPLRRLIEVCNRSGIEVWGHLGLWSYGGDVFPEYAMVDLWGARLDRRYKQWGIGLCPSRSEVNEWARDCLASAAQRYDVDGFCVDHARYPQPASLSALLACGCQACCVTTAELGGNTADAQRAVAALRRRLEDLRSADVRRLAAARPGPLELSALLDPEGSLMAWIRARAHLLARRMAELRGGLQDEASRLVWGSDVFAPSISLLGGHDYGAWLEATDYLTGGSSYGGVVGWATGAANVAASWAAALCRVVPGTEERDALTLAYGLFGYDDLQLPDTIEQVQPANLPLANLYQREIGRLGALVGDRAPLYPPITAGGDANLVRNLCRSVVGGGCHGAMLGLDPTNGDRLKLLAEELAPLRTAG